MKRKMVNIMTTMLLISNISINTVYASPIHLEPAPAPDMSITTEAENNSETTEETNEHNTSDMPDSNDGFHDGSEDVNHDGNEGYGLLEEVGGGVEETSSYINLGILQLDSFLVKRNDDSYSLNDYYSKMDEIRDYAKKKTKIKYFNQCNDDNISNSLNKTLFGIEYDEEKNMFYVDLEKSDVDYDSTYSKKNRTNDEKLYRVYLKLNYVYDGKRTADVDFNYIINDIKSKNEDEIDDIKLVDDEFYGESGYNYLNVEITDKNGNKYKSKIIIKTDQNQNQDYDQSGNINYDKPILTEEEIKNGQISDEHYEEIKDFIKNKNIFKPKNNFHIENSILHLDNNYRYYISLKNREHYKKLYLKTIENKEQDIDLNNLVVDEEVNYLQDLNSIIDNSCDSLKVKTVIDNGKKYNLISMGEDLLPLSSFVYKKYPNEKIVNVDKKEKDNDIYLIFNLTNDKQCVLKLNKIIIPNIKLNIYNSWEQNENDVEKTIKYFYKNQIKYLLSFTLFRENGQTKAKSTFLYSSSDDNSNKYITVNINNPDNETVDLFDPSTIPDGQENTYNINIKYNPNIDEIDEEGFYDAGTVEIDRNLDAKTYKKIISKDYGFGPKIDKNTDAKIRNSLKEKLNTENDIVPKNWQDRNLKYDMDKQKFYLEYLEKSTNPEDEKLYRFYFIGTNKDYEFSDEHDTKLDLTDEKDLDIVLAFIKQEYKNVKDIKLNSKNILTENNRNYLDVKITEDDDTEHDAKIFLKPTTMRPNEDVRDIYININVYSEEISNMKLSKETIKQVNDILNKKINNNVLYRDEYFVLNDNNIYKDDYERYYINIYDTKRKSNQKIYISIKDNLKADLLLEDENNNFDINGLKISEYKCNQYHKNNIYLSKNGKISILDYINSKLSDGLYADNLRLERFDNKIVADVKDKNTHEKKSNFIIGYNRFNNDEEELFFMNNIDDDLILTEKNKKDLEKLIRNTENINIKKVEFKENFEKETKNIDGETINYYIINATIYFENNYSQIKTYNVLVNSRYQDDNVFYGLKGMVKPGIPKPSCGDQESMNYNSPPAYGGKTYDGKYTKVKIKIPSANDFPDVTPCDPNKPNEDISNPPTPSEDIPKIPTPSNLPKISSPSPKTSNPPTVTERTPIVIIKNTPNVNGETRDKENADIKNSENTDGLPNIERTPVKTNDYLFSIISVFGIIGIFAYFINLMKNKHRNKSI